MKTKRVHADLTPVASILLAGWPLVLKLESQFHPCSLDRGLNLFSEIERQAHDVAAIVMPAGNGTTLHAAVQYRRKHRRVWNIFAACADEHTTNGLSLFTDTGSIPQAAQVLKDPRHVTAWVPVTDASTVLASKWLLRNGHFLGALSCAVIAATSYLISCARLPIFGRTVLVMPDGGELYRSTLYDDNFLLGHGFSIDTP